MSYFKKAKQGQKVYGLVFGPGEISQLFENSYYRLMVTFENGYEVPYTEEGIPGWGNFKKQTLFYKDDIDLTSVDFSPITKVLSAKKVIKLREKNKLEVRLPSGIWDNAKKCPKKYVETLLENESYHLFRAKE